MDLEWLLDSSLDMSPSLKEGRTGLGKVLWENLSTLHADEPGCLELYKWNIFEDLKVFLLLFFGYLSRFLTCRNIKFAHK